MTGRELVALETSEDEFWAQVGAGPDAADYLTQVMGHPTPAELEISPVVFEVTGVAPLDFRAWAESNRDALV